MAAQYLSRRDPFSQFRNDIDRLFQNLAEVGFPLARLHQSQTQGGTQMPLIDFYEVEDESGYRLVMDIPGFDPKDVEVNVSGNTLTVRAEHQEGEQQQQERNRNYLLIERNQSATLRREIPLPDDSDPNRINAEFRHGILAITIPKAQESQQRRRIPVKSS